MQASVTTTLVTSPESALGLHNATYRALELLLNAVADPYTIEQSGTLQKIALKTLPGA